jgi:hypothetical protein
MRPFTSGDSIYATGVFLVPAKRIVEGIEEWYWEAVGFEEDSFFDGELINPKEYATKVEDLVEEFEDDEDSEDDEE